MIIKQIIMKKLILLFNLILYLGASAQVTITLRSKYQNDFLYLDSIILDNLTQNSCLPLAAPPEINSYEIDLMQGRIINDIPENTTGASLVKALNTPGCFQVYATLRRPDVISVSLINMLGKTVRHWDVACQAGTSLFDLSAGPDQPYICKIQGQEVNGSFKMIGKAQNSIMLNVTRGAQSASHGRLISKLYSEFLYSPGDTIKFTAFKNNMHRNFSVSVPEDGDNVLIYLSAPCPGTPTVTDFDGNVYGTVLITDKCWMRENLKTRHYGDGSALVDGAGAGDITGDYITKYWFDYNDDPANSAIFGRYYTGAAMMNTTDFSSERIQGVCPTGWHVSTASEWCEMEKYYDESIVNCDFNPHGYFGNTIGYQLQDVDSVVYWPITTTNESGFKGLLGGNRSWEMFGGLYLTGQWWAYDNIHGNAYAQLLRVLRYGAGDILRVLVLTDVGMSVRCVKNY